MYEAARGRLRLDEGTVEFERMRAVADSLLHHGAGQMPEWIGSARLESSMMMSDALAASPVLAAGWAFLYLLFGGGFGGAVLLFIALKAFGR